MSKQTKSVSIVLSEDWVGSNPIKESLIRDGHVKNIIPPRSIAELLKMGCQIVSTTQTGVGTTLIYLEWPERLEPSIDRVKIKLELDVTLPVKDIAPALRKDPADITFSEIERCIKSQPIYKIIDDWNLAKHVKVFISTDDF